MNIRKTKIICTVGPAIESEKMLIKMFEAGMNVARLNFSHGDISESVKRIARIRTASAKTNKYVGIMLDTKGPEIRTGNFVNDEVYFNEGDIVKIVSEEILGNNERFYVNCKELFSDISVGDEVLIDDGKMSLSVISKTDEEFNCRVNTSGVITKKASMFLV